MFPIRDENPTARRPISTVFLIGLNMCGWMFIQGLGSEPALLRSLCLFGLIPGELLGLVPSGTNIAIGPSARCLLDGPGPFYTPITSMFLHGSWFHLVGNMWFLWVFGDNVEDAMGAVRFVVFYLLCGLVAGASQMLTDPDSVIPMVGASGAIGGAMGAYLCLYPRARIQTLVFLGFYVTTISVPAFAMLGYWFLLQVLGGLPTLAGAGGGVAFWAHVGGFVAGLAMVIPFSRTDYLAAHRALGRNTLRHRR